jgi:hypothetical protein
VATTEGAKGSPSVEHFCDAFRDHVDNLDDNASLSAVKDAYAQLEETGIPTGMPKKAREGLQLMLDHARDAKSAADLEVEDPTKDDMSKVRAISNYVSKTCGLND